MMRRRECIAGLGGAAVAPAAWRCAAQQAERVRLVGVLMHATSDEPKSQPRIVAFTEAAGAVRFQLLGRNVRIETRSNTGMAPGDTAERSGRCAG